MVKSLEFPTVKRDSSHQAKVALEKGIIHEGGNEGQALSSDDGSFSAAEDLPESSLLQKHLKA